MQYVEIYKMENGVKKVNQVFFFSCKNKGVDNNCVLSVINIGHIGGSVFRHNVIL